MTRFRRLAAVAFRAARRLSRTTMAALTPPPIPEGAQAHPDGGPGPYLPGAPGPRIAPLGIPATDDTPRPCPDEVESTDNLADGFDPVAEAERILRGAMP